MKKELVLFFGKNIYDFSKFRIFLGAGYERRLDLIEADKDDKMFKITDAGL